MAELLEAHETKLKPELVRNIQKGMKLSAGEIGHAEVEQGRLYRGMMDFFERYDLLVTPTTVVPPFEKNCRYPEDWVDYPDINWLQPAFPASGTVFELLHKLNEMGLLLTIDDFGTGYSSLSYLKKFPIHAIKIDRSFVNEINTNSDDAAIALAIISMAHSLKLKVVAEGVETKAQLTMLCEQKCDSIQGFFFSPPLVPENISEILAAESRGEGIGASIFSETGRDATS